MKTLFKSWFLYFSSFDNHIKQIGFCTNVKFVIHQQNFKNYNRLLESKKQLETYLEK